MRRPSAKENVSARGRFGIAAVAFAVIALMVVSIAGSFATDRIAAQSQSAVVLNTAYQKAASGVAAEESLERKYRLEPGPVPLAAHRAARAQVLEALADIRRLGTSSDRQLAAKVAVEHTAYVNAATAMFAAVDRRESSATVNAIDGRTVDPVFGAMQTQIYAAAASHGVAALRQLTAMRHKDHVVLGVDVATLMAGIVLIAAAAVALTRSHRRLRTQSVLNRYQALHDSLTGLPNRALFQDRTAHALEAAARTAKQVAVMLVDVNRFKDVNDTLGHHYGDLLLVQIAQRFTHALRAGDSVARLGGDEFAVLLCASDADDAVVTANRLTDVLAEPFTVKDISLDVEASIGIALAGPDADVETALRHADVAMYEAKSQHVPYVTYELTRDDNTVARLALLGDLRKAIGNGELVMEYQPKVRAKSGQLHSVEALVRWNHPTRGQLMPDDFIPVAEGTAVIHPLTDEILRQALAQARTWLDRGWPIPVAVNISTRSLHDSSFPGKVRRLLDAAGVPAHLLSLELTESAIMTDPARALTALEALNDMGICLSIDDFGTGYSSMSYLKDLPVKELKIDRSFVMDMNHDESDHVLVQSAVDLGHNLGLHVVAEGVENKMTRDALTEMGCDLVQGYHIRRPASAAELDEWLSTFLFAPV
jgi:diguanylate cyclase